MPIADFVEEVELHLNKVTVYKIELLDTLAYEFLNNANISDFHEENDFCYNNRVVIQCHKITIAQSFLESDFTCLFKCLKTYQSCHLHRFSLSLRKKWLLKPLMRILITHCIMVLIDLLVLAGLLVGAPVLSFRALLFYQHLEI